MSEFAGVMWMIPTDQTLSTVDLSAPAFILWSDGFGTSDGRPRQSRLQILVQVRRKPLFNLWQRFTSACPVIFELIAADLSDPKVF